MQDTYSICAICKEDLLNAGLDEALIDYISDDDMIRIAERIGYVVSQLVDDEIVAIANEIQEKAIEDSKSEVMSFDYKLVDF